MKAITRQKYGSPSVLTLSEIPEPTPGPGQVCIAVAAASVNPYDWHLLRGEPYILRFMMGLFAPKEKGLGADVAGTITALGEGVEGLDIGDEVFGWGSETFAQFALAKATSVARKPPELSFAAAACLPCAGVTALQALRDKALVHAGQQILINGAAGGIGTVAVQVAKSMGATVTAVCGPTSGDLVRSLGADDVIDYSHVDFSRSSRTYDIVLDVCGNRSMRALRRAAGRNGAVVLAAGSKGKWFKPLRLIAQAGLQKRFVSQRLESVMANVNRADLEALRDLCLAGDLSPVIEESCGLDDVAAAISRVEAGHVHGKIVITVEASRPGPDPTTA
jgi:NADPH:quinone reductase-like Zn-dependent oxidoreductase